MFNAFQEILDEAGQIVLINDIATNVVITNPPLSEYEEKYLHTLETVSQGDIVTYMGERYLVITESVTKRSAKYKALIRHCNVLIEMPGEEVCVIVGENEFGEPITECTTGEPIFIPAIVDNKSFAVDDSAAIRVPDNHIVVIVQDNQINRDKFQLNNTFTFEGSYKVIHRDFTKRGLMILTCEMV